LLDLCDSFITDYSICVHFGSSSGDTNIIDFFVLSGSLVIFGVAKLYYVLYYFVCCMQTFKLML